MSRVKFSATDLSQEWRNVVVQSASSSLKKAIQAIINAIEDHWPDDNHLRFHYSLSNAKNRLSIPRLVREELNAFAWPSDKTVLKILKSIRSKETLLSAIQNLELHSFNKHHQPHSIHIHDDPWEGPTPLLNQEEADIKCLCDFLSLLLDQFSKHGFISTAFDHCSLCPRMFSANHLGRRYCHHHSPKKNRATYDKDKKLRIHPPTQEIADAIQQACFYAFKEDDPKTIVDSLYLLPSTAPILQGSKKETAMKDFILFVIHRLDVLDNKENESDLLAWLCIHPPELVQLLYNHEAHANAYLSPQKKRGVKPRIDPALAKKIRGRKPNQKTFQEVADILAQEHKIFATRQAVSQAMKKR